MPGGSISRPGEACSLRWDQIRGNVAVLEEWKNRRKTGLLREIHLTRPVLRLLQRIARDPDRHPLFVFTHSLGRNPAGQANPLHGEPWTGDGFTSKFRRWRNEYGAAGRLTSYAFRHCYCSDALMAGLTEAEVANLAGTSAAMIAQVYGHIQRTHSAAKADVVEEMRRRAGK
jgi:integrase